jgi:hypothetical protein
VYLRYDPYAAVRHSLHDAHLDRAETLADSITDPYSRARALTELVTVGHGDHTQHLTYKVETHVCSITHPYSRARALIDLVTALATTGNHNHARRVAHEAEALAHRITDLDSQVQALTHLVIALATTGGDDHARRVAHEAEALAHCITHPDSQTEAQLALITALATAGHFDHAETLTRSISHPRSLAEAIDVIVGFADKERSRRLIAWGLTKVRSTALLVSLAKIEPLAVLGLAQTFRIVCARG